MSGKPSGEPISHVKEMFCTGSCQCFISGSALCKASRIQIPIRMEEADPYSDSVGKKRSKNPVPVPVVKTELKAAKVRIFINTYNFL